MLVEVAGAVGIAVDIGQAQPCGELTAYLLLYRMRELDSVVACPEITAVEAETAPDNEISVKVLVKNGFASTGTFGEEGPRFIKTK